MVLATWLDQRTNYFTTHLSLELLMINLEVLSHLCIHLLFVQLIILYQRGLVERLLLRPRVILLNDNSILIHREVLLLTDIYWRHTIIILRCHSIV